MPDISLWLLERGMSEDILLVLTFIPLLVTLTTISRYITGIKTFGIYASMVLAFAYYYMGFIQGFTVTLLIVICSWIVRHLLKRRRLHYLSRLAIVYTCITIFLAAFMITMSYVPSSSPYFNFLALPVLPLAMIISITDRFMSTYVKKDFTTALQLTAETLLLSLLGWGLMRWDVTREFFTTHLWIVPLLILVNILVGQYSGLRWTEFIRFIQVIQHGDTPDSPAKK